MCLKDSPRCVLLFASLAPLSCLIFDHRLWPELGAEVVEKDRHRGQIGSIRGSARNPLDNTVIAYAKGCYLNRLLEVFKCRCCIDTKGV